MNWKSKKFWVAVVGVCVPGLNAVFGLGLAVDEVLTIIGPLMAYLIGQGIADQGKEAALVVGLTKNKGK